MRGKSVGVTAIHHLGWAVTSIDNARSHFETVLGLELQWEETFPNMRIAFVGAGPVTVELIEPFDDTTDVGKFLARHGEGLHHLALKVDDVTIALDDAASNGFVLLDESPRPGARGTLIGFADPRRADGVLVQYVQDL
ncbi:MAG: methylmalonyl-CoA epimerase [Candidatus Dormibacteraceae bacterium]